MSEEATALDLLKQQLEYLAEGMKPSYLKMAQALAEGKTQTEAYKISGGKGKDPRKCAHNLIKTNVDISRYSELASKLATLESQAQLVATKDQKRRMLWDIAKKSASLKVEVKGSEDPETGSATQEVFDATSAKTAVSAVAELNKMDGDLAAIKQDIGLRGVDSLIDELTSGDS